MDYMPRTRKLLDLLGFMPSDRVNTIYFLSQKIQHLLLIYFISGAIAYTIGIIDDSKVRISTRIETILKLLILTTLSYGYLSLFHVKDDIEKIFDKIVSMNEFGQLEKAKRKHELVDYFSVFMVWFCWFGGFLISLLPIFDIKNCKNYNLKHNTTILCGFSMGLKYPYDISSGYFYYSHWIFQQLIVFLICTKGTTFIGAGFGFYIAVISRCKDLCDQLRQYNTYDNFSDREKCLHHCVYYHIRIIELADYINVVFAWITFPCIVSHNLVIGIGCMGMMKDVWKDIRMYGNFLPTITWIVALLAGCYLGEKVMQESSEIAVVAYELDWHKSPKLRREIAMMILRAQYPIKLKCGKFGELSMIAFKNIMQSAYAYATMQASNSDK